MEFLKINTRRIQERREDRILVFGTNRNKQSDAALDPGVVVHVFNPSSWEAKAAGLHV